MGPFAGLLGLKLSRSKVHFSFRAERHAVNNYRLVMLSALSFVSFSFLARRSIFSSESRKKSSKKMISFKV